MKEALRKKLIRKTAYMLAVMILLTVSWDVMASQTEAELKKAGQKIDKLEEQKEEAEEKVDQLKAQESGLKGELAGLNQELSDVSMQINDLEEKIEKKEHEIEETGRELQEAQAAKTDQYERMKLRIQFVYEKGSTSIIGMFFGSSSMADFLNRAEYMEEINKYDRELLFNYEETCKQVAEKEQTLMSEKEELIAMQQSMEEKENKVNSLITKTQESISDKQAEISDAKDAVDEFEAQIEKMKAYEEELERKKIEEARKYAEEQRKKQEAANLGGGGTVTNNAGDLAILAAIVECEAGGESYEGQLAVASVVVNRVKSGAFPNTVSGVVYQGGQFSPVASGRFAIVLARGANASCTQAANAALSGATNINALYFCGASAGIPGTIIGNHVFY